MRQVHAHKIVQSDAISLLGKQYFLFLYNTSGAKKESCKTEHKSSELLVKRGGGAKGYIFICIILSRSPSPHQLRHIPRVSLLPRLPSQNRQRRRTKQSIKLLRLNMQEGKMRRQFTWKDERKGLLAYSSCDGLMAKILPMTDNGRDSSAHIRPKWSASKRHVYVLR